MSTPFKTVVLYLTSRVTAPPFLVTGLREKKKSESGVESSKSTALCLQVCSIELGASEHLACKYEVAIQS